MSQGRNAEALKVFQKIYAINKGQPAENYPVSNKIAIEIIYEFY